MLHMNIYIYAYIEVPYVLQYSICMWVVGGEGGGLRGLSGFRFGPVCEHPWSVCRSHSLGRLCKSF